MLVSQIFNRLHSTTYYKSVLTMLVLGFLVGYSALAQSVDFTSSNLPIVIIETNGQSIPFDDPRIVADMRIIFDEEGGRNTLTDTSSHYLGKISIEIRGESSAGWDTKSYGLETQNDDGTNRNVSLLGLPEENDWILHAPYYDRSLMRNALSFHLSREMGWYASRTVYCEVMLNGEYQGVYILLEKIKRDKNRVDIATLSQDEISGDDVTGGYILRLDKEALNPGIDSRYPSSEFNDVTLRYQYYYPKADEIAPEQEVYIREFIHAFEDLMRHGDYSNPVTGYANYLNIDSFVDYFILNELSRNVDGYRLSSYLIKQKDSDGGKILAGPVWDYNFSYGNVGYGDAYLIEGWQLLFFTEYQPFLQGDIYQVFFWWKILFYDAEFRRRLRERWSELRTSTLSLDSLNNVIDGFADVTSEARVRNFQMRPEPGSTNLGGGWYPDDPRHEQINSYEDEIALTKSWIADRIDWMDENILLLTSNEVEVPTNSPHSYSLEQNYPNPFNPSTIINFEVPSPANVTLKIYNIQGQLVEQLVNKRMAAGKHQVSFDGQKLSSGIYFYSLEADNYLLTKKMLLLK